MAARLRTEGLAYAEIYVSPEIFRRFGLLVDEGVTAIIVALEVGRGGLAAEIAIDALIIDVEFSLYVFGIFVCDISHKALRSRFGLER